MLAVASVPVYATSQLDEGILCVLALGKLGNGEVFKHPLMKGDRLSFSSQLKCHQEATH
jgi:hypothetical protein